MNEPLAEESPKNGEEEQKGTGEKTGSIKAQQ